jgi:hypothetical protein
MSIPYSSSQLLLNRVHITVFLGLWEVQDGSGEAGGIKPIDRRHLKRVRISLILAPVPGIVNLGPWPSKLSRGCHFEGSLGFPGC